MKWEPTITLGNIIELAIFVGFIFKAYGNWRVLNTRINLMWGDYCKRHNLEKEGIDG